MTDSLVIGGAVGQGDSCGGEEFVSQGFAQLLTAELRS